MNDFYSKKWPDLDQFITICFHEDMEYEFPAVTPRESAERSVKDFFRTNPRKQVERICVELEELLSLKKSEDELAEALIAMHCRWDFRPFQPWLESVLNEINSFLQKPSTSPTQNSTAHQGNNTKADSKQLPGTADSPSDDRLRRREVSYPTSEAGPDAQNSPWVKKTKPSISSGSEPLRSHGLIPNRKADFLPQSNTPQPSEYARIGSGPSPRLVAYIFVFIFLAACVTVPPLQVFLLHMFGPASQASGPPISHVNQTQSTLPQPNWQRPNEYLVLLTIDKEVERGELTVGNATTLIGLRNLNQYAMVSFNRPHDLIWIWCPDGYRLSGARSSTGNQIVPGIGSQIGLVNYPTHLSKITFVCNAM